MKRITSLLLVLAFLLAIPMAVSGEEDVITTITMFYPTSRSTNDYTNLVVEAVKEAIGVEMVVYAGSASEWKQQLSLYITSGEVPDIVAYMDVATFTTYAEQGVWYDLTSLIDDYPDIRPYVAAQTSDPDSVWARMTVDGKLYGIPYMSGCACKYLNVLRKDWMQNLGLEYPTTLDELTEILRAFTFDDPDGNGIKDTYGYGNASSIVNLTEFFGAFGATPREDTLLYADGKLYSSVISDEYRAALEYLRDIYAEGLIYPEIFTMTETQRYEEFVRGTYGCTTWWWTHGSNVINRYGFLEANPNGDIMFFDPVAGPDGYAGHVAEDPIMSVVAVSASCQNPEKALELLNYQATYDGYCTVYLGPEGQFWTKGENGKRNWDWTLEGVDKLGNAQNAMEYYKILGNNPVQNESKLLMKPSIRNNISKEQIIRINTAPIYSNVFVGLITPEYQQYGSETQKYFTDYTIKFITGEKNLDEEWDSYVEGYLACGGEAIRQSLLDLYNEKNGTNLVFGN